MESIIHVENAGTPYAIICKNAHTDDVRFFTNEQDELQVGLMECHSGYKVRAHTHPRTRRSINGVSEFLYIESGKISVSVFDEQWLLLANEVLEAGDFLLCFRGGHSIEIIERARIIEVKQGPYLGNNSLSKTYREST